jgi:ribosomal protein L16/L10AE
VPARAGDCLGEGDGLAARVGEGDGLAAIDGEEENASAAKVSWIKKQTRTSGLIIRLR